jgi:hypothetical protein
MNQSGDTTAGDSNQTENMQGKEGIENVKTADRQDGCTYLGRVRLPSSADDAVASLETLSGEQ